MAFSALDHIGHHGGVNSPIEEGQVNLVGHELLAVTKSILQLVQDLRRAKHSTPLLDDLAITTLLAFRQRFEGPTPGEFETARAGAASLEAQGLSAADPNSMPPLLYKDVHAFVQEKERAYIAEIDSLQQKLQEEERKTSAMLKVRDQQRMIMAELSGADQTSLADALAKLQALLSTEEALTQDEESTGGEVAALRARIKREGEVAEAAEMNAKEIAASS